MITQDDLKLFTKISQDSGFKIDSNDLQLLSWQKGIATHKPTILPKGFFAVYIFEHENKYLKVGKVSGETNNDRYYQHHYIIKGANSTLAKSLVNDSEYSKLFKNEDVKDWILNQTSRYNILIPKVYGRNFVNFAEAFFILKCDPRFEGRKKSTL